MSHQILKVLALIIFLFIVLYKTTEKFHNYLSVYDGDKSYMRFLDYIHGHPQYPNNLNYPNNLRYPINLNYPINPRKGLMLTDLRGDPHLIDYRSDPLIVNPEAQDYKGMVWGMPHNRKIIVI